MKMEMPVTIRLGTSLLNQATVFNDLWNKYKLQYPNMKIDLVSFDDDAIKDDGLAEHLGKDFDAFVGVFDSNLWYKNILFLKMKECQFCVAVPTNHELARKSLIKPQDLAGYQFIMPQYNSSPSVTALEDYLKRESPNIEIIHTVSNYDINIFNKAATHSVAMMSIDCWKDLHPNLITIPLESKIKIPYGIVYSKDKTKEIEIFINIMETII